jgi:hypothetical protein
LTALSQKAERPSQQGKLRIGNDWNAITIIALSQSNPLIKATVSQGDIERSAEALITITHELLPQVASTMAEASGLPGYTFESAPGESWRSKFDSARNIIVVNNGHRDFVYAARNKSLKLRYLIRLYAKELVLKNFVGLPADQLLERMIELTLRTEEKL